LWPMRMYRGKLRWRTGANEHKHGEHLFRHRGLQELSHSTGAKINRLAF
jgi:hypothetical protein